MNIVITGASRGLGKAIAEKFGGHGYDLYLCSRSEGALSQTAKELSDRYPSIQVLFKAADLSVKSQAKAFGNWLLQSKTGVDILVNNAGVFEPGNIYDEADDVLEKMMAVNLYSAYYLTKILVGGMMERRRGHIFNMCSIASLGAYSNGGSYSISKFALAGFSKNLRLEMMPHGVKVTAVYPGAVYTDSWAGTGVARDRIMEAEDIAGMIYAASLLSPQACVEDIVLRPQQGDL